MRGAMRSVMGMRDECLYMRVINFSALRCPRDFTDCRPTQENNFQKCCTSWNLYGKARVRDGDLPTLTSL